MKLITADWAGYIYAICNTYYKQFFPPKLHGLCGFPYVSFELTTPFNRCGTGLVVTLQIIFKPYEGNDFEADNIISIRDEKYGTAAGLFPADCKFQTCTHSKCVGTNGAAVCSGTNLYTLPFCLVLFDDDFRLSLPIDSILSSNIWIWCTTCAINRNKETKFISKWTPSKRECRKILLQVTSMRAAAQWIPRRFMSALQNISYANRQLYPRFYSEKKDLAGAFSMKCDFTEVLQQQAQLQSKGPPLTFRTEERMYSRWGGTSKIFKGVKCQKNKYS